MQILAIPKLPPRLQPRRPEHSEYLSRGYYPVRDTDQSDYEFGGTSKWGIAYPFSDETFGLFVVPACYCIFLGKRLVYIGSTVNLRQRVMHHDIFKSRGKDVLKTEWGFCLRQDLMVKYKTFRDNGEWLALEYRLIKRLHPLENKRGAAK
jgi:hypothetical protein